MISESTKKSIEKYREKNKEFRAYIDPENYELIMNYIKEHDLNNKEFFREAALYYIDNH